MSAAPAGSPSLALRTPSSRWRPSPVLVRCRADAHQGLGATNGGGGGGDGVAAEIRDRSHHGGRQADPWPDGLGRMTISVAVCRTGVDRRPARRDSEFRYGASPIRVRRSFLRRGHQLAVRRGASRRNRRPVGDHVDVGSRRRPGPVKRWTRYIDISGDVADALVRTPIIDLTVYAAPGPGVATVTTPVAPILLIRGVYGCFRLSMSGIEARGATRLFSGSDPGGERVAADRNVHSANR